MPHGDQFIETAGARLRVRCVGQGEPLLLIHGWALDLDMWSPQFAALCDRYRLIAFDRRGFGGSTGAPSLQRDVEDAFRVLDACNVDRATVLGMSQGARVALRIALQAPQRLLRIVLDGPPPLTTEEGFEEVPMREYRELVRTRGFGAFRARWAQHPFMQLRTADPAMHGLLARISACYSGADLRSAASSVDAFTRDEIRHIRTPALVINGAHDVTTRLEVGEQLAGLLSHAQRSVIADAAHLPNLDNPSEYHRVIGEFISRAHS